MTRMFQHEPPTAHDDPEARADDLLEDADDPDLAGADDDEDDDDEAETEAAAPAEGEAPAEEEYAGGPDDALGLYLRQMGAIPLLNKERETALAQKLEHHRDRFRAASLLCGRVLIRVADKFE
jgi:RNA polymerase primary sigma factor